MPIHWEIDHGAILMEVEGSYSTEELELAVSAALFSPQFPLGGALLFDGRRATGKAGPDFLERRAQLIRSLFDHGVISRCAVVTSPDRADLARKVRAKIRSSGADMEILKSMDQGREWLEELGEVPQA